VTGEGDQGGEAPCWAHLVDDLGRRADPGDDPRDAAVTVHRSNTILYCDRWADVVAFYRTDLGLRVTAEREWFIEFALHPGSHLSVADASRTSIAPGDGSGLTLSWQIDDIDVVRARLVARGIAATPIEPRWGSSSFYVVDPAGNRIECWSDS
jgi:predicted enzyme related to lactoylglutathione lyase